MPGYHKKPNKHKATKDNSVYGNKPKFILGAIGNALAKGSSSFGRTAGNLLAGKLFGVDPSEAIKASNPNETTMNMMNMYTGGMLGRPMMQQDKKKKTTKYVGVIGDPAQIKKDKATNLKKLEANKAKKDSVRAKSAMTSKQKMEMLKKRREALKNKNK